MTEDTKLLIADRSRDKEGDWTFTFCEIDMGEERHRFFNVYLWAEDIPKDTTDADLAVIAREKAWDTYRDEFDWQYGDEE